MEDLKTQARWIMNNLTVANKALIDDALRIEIPQISLTLLKANLKIIAVDRTKALAKAIETGECKSSKYPDFRNHSKQNKIAEIMQNLVAKKE